MGVGSIPDWDLTHCMAQPKKKKKKKILPCTWYIFLIFQIDFSQSMNSCTTETNVEIKQHATGDQWVNEEIKEKI